LFVNQFFVIAINFDSNWTEVSKYQHPVVSGGFLVISEAPLQHVSDDFIELNKVVFEQTV